MEASAEPAAPDPMPEPYEPGEASATDVGHEVIPAVSPPVLHVEPVGNVEQSLECEPRLQEIFMTEETIGLERAVELCGGLPGIRACILAKGSNVLAAHNAPPHLDLVSLTANAAAMVEAVRSSALRMGLGEIPAVTAHSESGPISFFHASDLALLVLHSDRGFVPGVRERLRDVLLAMGTSGVSLRLGAGDRG
jgi:predicted regulator of Ras-like GTPase activity (Roadblock/LC7/MglB family)